MDINITNNHLKNVMNETKKYLDRQQNAPENLVLNFFEELKVSNLIIAGIIENETLTFDILQLDDGIKWISLFTDENEYLKVYSKDIDLSPIPNEFEYYVDLINNSDIEGIVINIANEEFPIEKELINQINIPTNITFNDNFEGYGPEQLENIAKTISNDSLINFINDNSNVGDYDGLFLELSKSTLLNIIMSDKNLENNAKNGIINAEDVGGFNLCTSTEDDGEYAIIFSSRDKITQTINNNSEFYFYSQITILSKLIDFVLYSDGEGIILNPGSDNVLIPRSVLLSKKFNSPLLDNPSFKNALDYAFLI